MDKYIFNKKQKYLRTINFDLDTKALQEQYPKENWRKAYDDIGKFLKSKGFSHRQGSGYISNEEISMLKVTRTLNELKREFPFLNGCVNKIDVASIVDKRFDYAYIFEPTNTTSKANEKADTVEKDNNMSDDKTVDVPQDKLTEQNKQDKAEKSESDVDCLFNADCNVYDEDDELNLTEQSQNRGRS